MKLHDILYGIGFCCVLIGMAGVDGWMFNGTSLLVPIALILEGALMLYLAKKEDCKIRKGKRFRTHRPRQCRTNQ